eukprot:11214176-Lingulodinium_polyedra.AAC.1
MNALAMPTTTSVGSTGMLPPKHSASGTMSSTPFRCSVDKFFFKEAGVLCRAWAHRCQAYYNMERVDPMGQG